VRIQEHLRRLQPPSLLLEEKVSPAFVPVTDVVENVTNLPEARHENNPFFRTPHQSKIGSEAPIFASFS